MKRISLGLTVLAATLALASPPASAETLEGEALTLPSGSGMVVADAQASAQKALLVWSNATAVSGVTLGAGATRLTLRARGDQCAGAPEMVVRLDGRTVLKRVRVKATAWSDYGVAVDLGAGAHRVEVGFTNDLRTSSCDRNLRVDRLVFTPGAVPNPFAGALLYVDPDSNARRQADAWRATRPADALQMEKLAGQSQADWFGDWNSDIRAAVDARVTTISASGALPVLVAYDIPNRDCGGYSSGGAAGADAYRAWIRAFAEGIGSRRAAVVLEPDALASDCGTSSERLALIADAVDVLAARPGVAVYLDAGHSRWRSAAWMADALKRAGIERARGFSLNVSNHQLTSTEITYGKAISDLVGGKPFVIDTSRNGLGSTSEWCNAPGRALGDRPGALTADARVDAYLWIKRPGESDGTCNGGPSAGAWWPDYALGLAQRAAW